MLKKIIFLIIVASLFSCESIKQKKEVSIDHTIYKRYKLIKADDIVVDAFKNSDIVILGERHYIREQVLFVADLIPKLYENGVFTLYSEFTYLDDKELVNTLINAETFDEQLAKNLLVSSSGWYWSYKEYIELYRSAWALNKTIKKGKKFEIIGLSIGRDFNAIQAPEDWKNSKKRMAYFRETEKDWANRIISNTAKKGEKALVYCGYNHGFTFYKQPYVLNNKFIRLLENERVGQHLYETLKENCKYFFLHSVWQSKINEDIPITVLGGKLDQLSDSLSVNYKSYGFYTKESSLGEIIDTTSYFSWGYSSFKLQDLSDGYIVIKSVCELNLCNQIPNFIDSTNIEIARLQIRAGINILNISIKEANNLLNKGYNEQLEDFNNDKKKMDCFKPKEK